MARFFFYKFFERKIYALSNTSTQRKRAMDFIGLTERCARVRAAFSVNNINVEINFINYRK